MSASKPITHIDMAPHAKRPLEHKPSPQEWLNVKNDIERLYVAECHNLRYVAHVLKHRRGFDATLRMFKSRIKEWNFDQKTIRQADWRFMFQEYVRRKKLSTPKETIFCVSQDRHGRVTKYKTIKHIRTYMRRKQVSEDEFLSSPSDRSNFPHIRSITPPLSPATSPASASPSSQVDGDNIDAATPASLMDITGTNHRPLNGLSLQNSTIDVSQQYTHSQGFGWPSDPHQGSIVQCGSFSSQGGSNRPQMHAPPFGRPAESLTAGRNSPESSASANETLLHGSERMAIQTFASDRQTSCEDVELYRSVARSPSSSCSEPSESDNDLSATDLARTLSDIDEDDYSEQDSRSLVHVSSPTDLESAKLRSFKPDVDEARAFRWASRYFLACILQGRMQSQLADTARASATRIFLRMLESETRSPCSFPRPTYVPSHRSRFILSGLSLMATVLSAHGRDDMLKKFLVDSRLSIKQFFKMDDHPLSAPYAYLLSLMDDKPMDDEAWERTLASAHTKIHHVWNGGPNAVVSHYYWAWHVLKRKRYAEAVEGLKTCYEKASNMFGECHIITVNCLSTIARAFSEQGMYDEARPWLVDTIKRSQRALGDEHPFCYKLIERLGDMYQQLGDLRSAEATFRDVVNGRKTSLGLNHGHTSTAVHKLEQVLIQQNKQAERARLVRDLDEEHQKQQFQHWEREKRYFPDSRQSHFTHPSLPIPELIKLH
jgi:tetratricopeptide (TPR) repeat protein